MKLVKKDTFKVTVKVDMPDGDSPDKKSHDKFIAEYRYMDRANAQALADDMADGEMKISDVLDEVLVGVEGVADDQGAPYPRDEALRLVKDNLFTSMAAFNQFFISITGAAAKNSKRSRTN